MNCTRIDSLAKAMNKPAGENEDGKRYRLQRLRSYDAEVRPNTGVSSTAHLCACAMRQCVCLHYARAGYQSTRRDRSIACDFGMPRLKCDGVCGVLWHPITFTSTSRFQDDSGSQDGLSHDGAHSDNQETVDRAYGGEQGLGKDGICSRCFSHLCIELPHTWCPVPPCGCLHI